VKELTDDEEKKLIAGLGASHYSDVLEAEEKAQDWGLCINLHFAPEWHRIG